MQMESNSSQLLENLIYRANIFNYDNKFLLDIKSSIKLNLSMYSHEGKEYFKY